MAKDKVEKAEVVKDENLEAAETESPIGELTDLKDETKAQAGADILSEGKVEAEEKVEAPKAETTKSVDAPIAVEVVEPLVQISLKEPVRCKIGEIWYNLDPGIHKVPKNVKEAFRVAGKLNPL